VLTVWCVCAWRSVWRGMLEYVQFESGSVRYIYKLKEGVRIANLLFVDQHFLLTEYLYVKGFPTIHVPSLSTCFE